MEVTVIEASTGKHLSGLILPAKLSEMPAKGKGWQFSWRQIGKTEGANLLKLMLDLNPLEIQGLMMTTLVNREMLFMNNIEVAPHNYGKQGTYEGVAGALIAYGCKLSFELATGAYQGYLAFDSKTALIPYYQTKYGATHALGQKMYFDPDTGRQLMKAYLGISFKP